MTSPRGPAPILGSFHYWRRLDLPKMMAAAAAAGLPVDFFADSGAFSAATTGARITVADYAAWLAEHRPVINFAAGLDVISDPAGTRRNLFALEDRVGDTVTILPTFHVGTPWPELAALCRTYRYVALGGAAVMSRRRAAMMAWLARCHSIGRDHGTVFHGFGLTRWPIPHTLPWYSVDSAYWTSARRTGSLSLFNPRQVRFDALRVGTRGALDHAPLLRSYGANPSAVAQPKFGRAIRERGDVARAEYRWLYMSTLESWLRYADWLTAHRPPVPAPPGVTGDGPKLYLAACTETDFADLITIHTTRDPRS
jgi:hypothetical protein